MNDIAKEKQQIGRRYKYQLDKNNDQIFKAMILSIDMPDGNETMETLRNKGDVISTIEVKSWFPKKFFEPTDQEIQLYTDQLNIIRVTVGYDQKEIDESDQIVFDCIEKLQQHLPRTRHSIKQSIDDQDPRQSIDSKNDNISIYNSLTILQGVISKFYINHPYFDHGRDRLSWHSDAFFLMFLLLRFTKIRKIKPSIKWIDSPIINIIQKSLTRTKAAVVSNDAVVKAIKKYPRYPFLKKFLREYTKQ